MFTTDVVTVYAVVCDQCLTSDGWHKDKRAAWRAAKAKGWKTEGDLHKCPDCAGARQLELEEGGE
jgi:hypothetical protein